MIGACEVLSHEPSIPTRSREHHPAEHAYRDQWHALVRAQCDDHWELDDEEQLAGPLGRILHDMPVQLTDRHSRIATTFTTWLGTNVGGSIIWELRVKGSADKDPIFDRSVLRKWHEQNHRHSFCNFGFRSSDYLTSADWDKPTVCRDALEIEVFDHLANWLGSADGRQFIAAAEARAVAYAKGLSTSEMLTIQAGGKEACAHG
ncbi:hypothetical protein ACEU0C_001277 [Stenotrophomonas indicatrix]|uniref:hypothetical protein n=1 Tax=Stenotrophomonas indicatrix TaxID=2045451 RepID=UPI003731562F